MSKSSSSLLEGPYKLPPQSIKLTCGRSADLADFPTDCYFSLTALTIFSGVSLLPTDWQTASTRNDRERINRTRQNAEDLFKPTRQPTRADVPASAPNDAPSAEHQPRRQPRIFAIPPMAPMTTAKVEPAAEPKRTAAIGREAREIPASQFGRVRTLTKYGMTRAQVAELYGVIVDEIEKIIRRPDQPRKS
jgi:hypothetical protein